MRGAKPGNLNGRREVAVEPLREAFLRSGQTQAEVAMRLGWLRSDRPGQADVTRFARAIGLKPMNFSRGYGIRYIETTSYDRAVKIAEAIGLDPVDAGL